MKQTSMLFRKYDNTDRDVSDQLNIFLDHHPSYKVVNIQFNSYKDSCKEELFVLFNLDDTTNQPEAKPTKFSVVFLNPDDNTCRKTTFDTPQEAEESIENDIWYIRTTKETPDDTLIRKDDIMTDDGDSTRLYSRKRDKLYIWIRLWKHKPIQIKNMNCFNQLNH